MIRAFPIRVKFSLPIPVPNPKNRVSNGITTETAPKVRARAKPKPGPLAETGLLMARSWIAWILTRRWPPGAARRLPFRLRHLFGL